MVVIAPYVSGYLSPHLKLKNLKGEARGHEAKELFERIQQKQKVHNQTEEATKNAFVNAVYHRALRF